MSSELSMEQRQLLTITQAAQWASQHLQRDVTASNITYLIQYGRIAKILKNGKPMVAKDDLVSYYESYAATREASWTRRLGEDLNWALSFDHLAESERTKHVHRLHPYKGKFIPQLVEYFLDDHVNEFKREAYFKKGDVVLDPFCGSGTALVQANELGMHAIGIDVSSFNSLIANVKIGRCDLAHLYAEAKTITAALRESVSAGNIQEFDDRLAAVLSAFNREHFPSPEYKAQVNAGAIDERTYGSEKERVFLSTYNALVSDYQVELRRSGKRFLDEWYIHPILQQIELARDLVARVSDTVTKDVLTVILSRTTRSCRATTHSDLATLIERISSTYYCHKHGKICKPLFSIVGWWTRYVEDTVKRLGDFAKIRTDTDQLCLTGDSRTMDLTRELRTHHPGLARLTEERKIQGIFSSPPYVGLIDYHDQHAYAYDLFGLARKDDLEIGALGHGQGREARTQYLQSISEVLLNCRRFLAEDANVFLVANDKHDLYPVIAEKSGLSVIQQFRRPVLNRTERDKGAYSETIFHMRRR